MPLPVRIILIVLGVILVLFAVLIIIGRKMQNKQQASQADIEAASQVFSMLIIDKKKMKAKDSTLPKAVTDQIPKYMRLVKLPLVKAKVGPRVMTLIADAKIYDTLPLKTEVKVKVSGIYITEIISTRAKINTAPKKKGLRAKLQAKANEMNSAKTNTKTKK